MNRPDSPSFLFHRVDFTFRNPESLIISFPRGHAPHSASIHFTRKNNDLISLDKSPFGGLIVGRETSKSDLVNTMQSVVAWATSNHIDTISIRCFPEVYSPEQSLLTTDVLTSTFFNIKYKDITQAIKINPGLPVPFNVHRKRRLKKCMESRFFFRQLSSDELPKAYALFSESRKNKGYPITMTLPDLIKTFEQFPAHYILFGVLDDEKIIAAAVTVVVSKEILYCFYIGDSLAYRPYSPVTFLVSGIYDYCIANNFKLLDLGISTDKGVLNKGLYSFKKSLGCIDSCKLTFEKIL